MSDDRIPDIRLSVKLPRKAAINQPESTLFELYLVAQFESTWSFNKLDKFYPRVPLRHADRGAYWQQQIYRVRIKGKWLNSHGYTFYSKDEIWQLIEGNNER